MDDLKYAAAAGAISYGFPTIADTIIPEILPTGVTRYEHVISMPWNEIEAEDDTERAAKLVMKGILKNKADIIVTHELPLEKHEEAIRMYQAREPGIKIVFNPWL